MQHGRHQNGQFIPLCLALPRQPLGQLRLDPFHPTRNPVYYLCHGAIPRQNERGIVASHPASIRQPIIAEN
jgi:hypothetical protein